MNTRDRFLLDTNVASDIFSGRSQAARRSLEQVGQFSTIAISVLTEAELLFGFHKRPEATRLRAAFERFCTIAEVLPWDSAAAHSYGLLRNRMSTEGVTLEAMDLLIAAHAHSIDAVLVTRDRALQQVSGLVKIVNWATDL